MHSEDVAHERFRTTRLQPGYDQREVDTFLDSAAEALQALERRDADATGLAATNVTFGSAAVASVRFTSTRYREGYHPADVDEFLDRLAAAFERLERTAAAGA